VAEKITLMDAVSDGRLVVGFGRGLARDEYERLHIPLNEARERFDESAAMIVEALRTGVIKGDGPFYPRKPTLIKPAPGRSFEDRLIAIGRSEDSVLAAADIGAALTFVVQKPVEQYLPVVTKYRERFMELHRRGAPPLWLINHLFVHEDAEEAERIAYEYMQPYNVTALVHYGYAGEHFATTKGYENYAAGAEEIRRAGIEESARKAVGLQVFGTPDQVLEILRERQRIVGDHVALFCVSYAGMPYEMANRNLTLFGEAVLPKLHAFPSVRGD
jgi:alkanesulfonate monooxygenase SsuD/methylene tetrahydromethanopterin reductase-like flavin-dependent oxidoreductase (luciferase family)